MTWDNLWLRILFHQESTLHCPMQCFVVHLNVEIRCRCSIVTRPDLSAIILYVNQIMFIALMVLASIIKHILQGRNTLLPRISFLMFRQTNMWSLEEKSHPLPTSTDSSIHMILIVETFIITMKEWDLAHTSLMMAGDFLPPFLVCLVFYERLQGLMEALFSTVVIIVASYCLPSTIFSLPRSKISWQSQSILCTCSLWWPSTGAN